jgi:hypothetical protein
MDAYATGFEEDEKIRSAFIREITLQQLNLPEAGSVSEVRSSESIPKQLIRYWHDPHDLPDDVRACLDSWNGLIDHGFELQTFSDASAAAYIAKRYGAREHEAFSRCSHPAMRCDYLRMCFLLAEGGFYVDADDVLRGDGWKQIFRDGRLKVQPLCYDIPARGMLAAADIWRVDLPTEGRIFYVNNDPIAAPPSHPVLLLALTRATKKLLGHERNPEIQSTTGPGNFTAALAAHARDLMIARAPFDFELLRNWDAIAETRWELSYRSDARNWRNIWLRP